MSESLAAVSLVELCFTVELEPLSGRSHYVGLFVRMCFNDRRVSVLRVDARTADGGMSSTRGSTPTTDGERLGGEPLAVITEPQRAHAAGIYFEAPGTRDSLPREYAINVTAEVPSSISQLKGTLRVDGSAVRRLIRSKIVHGHGPPVQFSVPLQNMPIERRPAVPLGHGGDAQVKRADCAGVRLCFAADIERFSRFRTPEAVRAQERFVRLLAEARCHAGVDESGLELEKSGDGQFVILPAGLDEAVVIPRLIEGLRDGLARINADLSERARLRIRAALHRGHVQWGVNGWVGESTIVTRRLLDSRMARQALNDRPKADLALIVSDTLYRDVIAHGYGNLAPTSFHRVIAEVPEKNFGEPAWIYTAPE
ncbi:hypothetical protein [Actinomadura rubrobrunea]|uniref:hypothetical protein n=1 Tax=Actinomadura rubrobrunea TaxID=115335 RepID=UPI0011B1DEDB|nr:hypothetical protein [Actinomadura rubrobrunea]